MKSKTYKLISAICVTAIALTIVHFSTGLFTPYNFISARLDIMNKNYRIIHYGESKVTDNIAEAISPEFGFKYEGANCSVTTPLINGIDSYNKIMTRQLDKVYGSDWFFDFEDRTDSIFRESRVDTIKQIISSQDDYKELEKVFEKLYHGTRKLTVWVLIHKDNGDNVRVCERFGDTAIRVFDHYHVDPYSLKVSTVRY